MNPSNETNTEEKLNAILLGYLEELEVGKEPDRETLLSLYPEFRYELIACFASHDEVERLTSPWRVQATTSNEDPTNHKALPTAALGILGDFRLIREIGHGGMGVVYEAEQISLRRRVALKVLPFAAAINPRHLQRFKNEAMAAAHLRHENIVPVFAVGCERGVHYYAMQFVEGQSLAALIADMQSPPNEKKVGKSVSGSASTSPAFNLQTERSNGGIGYYDWVARLGRRSALALEHAHDMGIVHRDIKPGNLLLDPQDQIWVADFGLAQMTGNNGLTITGELLGTLRYASPEQAIGRRGIVDHRSDIYSLGATLYELLTLRPPFEGQDRHELLRKIADENPIPPRASHATIPANLETIILKALRKDPADRYATAREFADDLERYLDRRPILARNPGMGERFRMWSRRHPTALLIAAIISILLTSGSLFTSALIRAEQEKTRQEQQRTEEAYRRERTRAEEAENRLILARRVVDELFRVSEEELADRPGMEMLRKRLLRSALAYYKEFLVERQNDPLARKELLLVTNRVEQILADLEVLRAAARFYLLLQPVVLDDLQLSTDQRLQMKEFTARVGTEWANSFRDIGVESHAIRGKRAIAQARASEVNLNRILTNDQQKRLRQIGLQAEGTSVFRDPEVASQLALTQEQRQKIRLIEDNAVFGWMRTMADGTPLGSGMNGVGEPDYTTIERILAHFSSEQFSKWREMTGEPIKGKLVIFGAPPPLTTFPKSK